MYSDDSVTANRGRGLSLPEPDRQAQQQSLQLIEQIRRAISDAGGALPFDRYMQLALYAPGLGYYSGGARKFGAEGDFVTAPELSPLFAHCLARQCQQVLAHLQGGEILEFGAGSGALAVELLRELDRLGALPQRYLILELSGELRQRQQQRIEQELAELTDRVVWVDSLPTDFAGVMIANEVLDAMPVQRFRIDRGELLEQFVEIDGEALALGWRAVESQGFGEAIRRLFPEGLPDDYESELNPQLAPWIAAIAQAMRRGLVLLIDYGYGRPEFYHPRRERGTLICHYRHRAHSDPLIYPGLQDITANVDFTAVAEAGLDAGFDLAGYSTQAFFLLGCGLDQIVAEADQSDAVAFMDLAQAVKRLTLPTEMGERFKVMGLGKGVEESLLGFSLREERERL